MGYSPIKLHAENQRRRLAALLADIRPSNRFYASKYASLSFDAIRDPLAQLPFTTRAEIEADQQANPPYGTNLTCPLERYTRMHQTSGSGGRPLRWLDTPESWAWWKRCWAAVYRAAGVSAVDRLAFPFSFGPFIGFWSAFESAETLGGRVLAAGGMSTAARVAYMLENAVSVVCCTPTYALHMAERAAADGIDIANSSVKKLIVAGEPGGNIPAVRARIEQAWGAKVFDHAGMTEIGAWGFEVEGAARRLLINETEFIAELIDPATGAPRAAGELGELVLTNLGRGGSPLIRYRTGDMVRMWRPAADATPASEFDSLSWCDGGILGRADDMIFIRGNNVFPSAIEGILREVAGVTEFRIEVTRREALSELRIEVERAPSALPAVVEAAVHEVIRGRLNFRPEVIVVEPNTLPRFEMKARRMKRS